MVYLNFRNSKIECEDLEDLITEYMDSELHTILEDNSVREVSKVILDLFDLFQSGKHDELRQEIGKLPHCDLWLDITYNTPRRQPDENSDCSSDSETEEANNTGEEPMDCEWTEVSYRKKG